MTTTLEGGVGFFDADAMPLDERLEQYLPSQSDWREFCLREFPRFPEIGEVPVDDIQGRMVDDSDLLWAWAMFIASEDSVACLHSDWEQFLADDLPDHLAELPLENLLMTQENRDLVIRIWGRFLASQRPNEYPDRPETEHSTAALPGPNKVDVMAERCRLKESLWHPDDATYEQADKIGRPIQVVRNGRNRGIKLVELGTDEAVPTAPQKAA